MSIRTCLSVACAWSIVGCSIAVSAIPMSGQYVPDFAFVDSFMTNLMSAESIPAATVAISHNRQIVYERGFGYSDQQESVPIKETALMRVASVSKPITAAAVHRLIKQGQLTSSQRVFDMNSNGGLLGIDPLTNWGDSRMQDITVQHLLEHRSGWDTSIAADPQSYDAQLLNDLGLTAYEAEFPDYARGYVGFGLQHDPGQVAAYSNIGYGFLGMVVEEASDESYLGYLANEVLATMQAPSREVQRGRTFVADQNPREPYYHSPYMGANVFDPEGPLVEAPYGTWDHEKVLAYGGLVTSAKFLATFAEDYIVAGPNMGIRRDDATSIYPGGYVWVHTGSGEGAESLIMQSTADVTMAIIFNQRPDGSSVSSYVGAAYEALVPTLESMGNNNQFPGGLVYVGDLDQDQWLSKSDIMLFNQAVHLGSDPAFGAVYPNARYLAGDFDGNGVVDYDDVVGFCGALRHAGLSETEIATVVSTGDYNDDGIVDAADYSVWRENLGSDVTLPGDTTPGLVTSADYDVWRSNFGASSAVLNAGRAAAPEPSAFLLLGLGAMLFTVARRSRN